MSHLTGSQARVIVPDEITDEQLDVIFPDGTTPIMNVDSGNGDVWFFATFLQILGTDAMVRDDNDLTHIIPLAWVRIVDEDSDEIDPSDIEDRAPLDWSE